MMESTHWHMGTEGRKLGIRWHNQQIFTNEAALGPVRQIIDNWLIRFSNFSNWWTFKDQIGSVALFVLPSSLPG